ncbi:hypothetical protein [Burkholderia cenocepacia]|uniref:hypothetical protein n=2 Tax=Burkholderia cenocepacia TaxID=95486 RepID=UPI001F4BC61F|nr:hypothetical protein [Burkholderia cenocepacia]
MDERETKNEVEQFADFCQEVARKMKAENPAIKSHDVFSSIAFSLWRERVIPVRNGVVEECAIRAAVHSQYPIENDYDRGYAQARLDAARSIRALKTTLTSDKGGA